MDNQKTIKDYSVCQLLDEIERKKNQQRAVLLDNGFKAWMKGTRIQYLAKSCDSAECGRMDFTMDEFEHYLQNRVSNIVYQTKAKVTKKGKKK